MQAIMKTPVKIPAHLKQYVVGQDYSLYSPINQAVWRYVMRRNVDFLGKVAHPDYIQGLSATGIAIDSIPSVAEMNRRLAELGWGAVVVDGLIPSVAFFDFQARGLLPISVDIRTLEHIQYTPAPDIIHEAAGHAPLLMNEEYREYVRIFGEIGAKALGTREGHEVFDALRNLTILLENPSSSAEEIAVAEQVLAQKRQVRRVDSEESQVSRLYWWTVEYGLMGSIENPMIYGAGLLSSVAEGKNCLTDAVKKIPFDLETCIKTRYDVTKPQPQLFVCTNFSELIQAVRELSNTMAFRVGGTASLLKGLASGRTATFVYRSNLQVTGTLSEVLCDDSGEAIYVRTAGPTSLSVDDQGLDGHGCRYHSDGFGSPIGRVRGLTKPLEDCSETDLEAISIRVGTRVELEFESGVTVVGNVRSTLRKQGKFVVISFSECTVTYRDRVLFQPSWGTYDMAVGEHIVSVFAGAADAEHHFGGGSESERGSVIPTALHVDIHTPLHDLYQQVRTLRESGQPKDEREINDIAMALDTHYPTDWLLRVELLELIQNVDSEPCSRLRGILSRGLDNIAVKDEELKKLINAGLDLIRVQSSHE